MGATRRRGGGWQPVAAAILGAALSRGVAILGAALSREATILCAALSREVAIFGAALSREAAILGAALSRGVAIFGAALSRAVAILSVARVPELTSQRSARASRRRECSAMTRSREFGGGHREGSGGDFGDPPSSPRVPLRATARGLPEKAREGERWGGGKGGVWGFPPPVCDPSPPISVSPGPRSPHEGPGGATARPLPQTTEQERPGTGKKLGGKFWGVPGDPGGGGGFLGVSPQVLPREGFRVFPGGFWGVRAKSEPGRVFEVFLL